VVDKTCYGQRNDGNNIWPPAWDHSSNARRRGWLAAAAVVPGVRGVNNAVVGRIFRIDVGPGGGNYTRGANTSPGGRSARWQPGARRRPARPPGRPAAPQVDL
jgi:hypothetical protein